MKKNKEHDRLLRELKRTKVNAERQALRVRNGDNVRTTPEYWWKEHEKIKVEIQEIVLNGYPTKQQILLKLPKLVMITGVVALKSKIFLNDEELTLRSSLLIKNHSPTGFSWGGHGSGPAQFALALLLKYVGKETALKYYMRLKSTLIASFPEGDFMEAINLRNEVEKIIMEDENNGQ